MSTRILFAMLIGVIAGAFVGIISTNAHWQWSAWNHRAAVWTYDERGRGPHFQWLDDYYFEQLVKMREAEEVHATPIPLNERL